MKSKDVLFLDFETKGIELRPSYPPDPVGYAWILNKNKGYVAWGHEAGGNNHTLADAKRRLKHLASEAKAIVCHHMAFDNEVSVEKMRVGHKEWHCTMLLAFIADPYQRLGLKELAVRHLGMSPDERDAVRDWLEEHRIVRRGQKDWGANIWRAPVSVVGPYALGDVVRTKQLFEKYEHLHNSEAYRRELNLVPVVRDMESAGVRVDYPKLEKDLNHYFKIMDQEDGRIRKILKQDVDLDEDQVVAEALEKAGKLRKPLPLTEKGTGYSVNKRALVDCIKDKNLLGALLMRNALATCLRTFMGPWHSMAVDGRIYFHFNQTRNDGKGGARTGRMSSSPNLMNLPSEWEFLYATLKAIGYKSTWQLPNLRVYILPDGKDGYVIAVDYSQQEMRLFAHYEDGELMRRYNQDPATDAHELVAGITGLTRKVSKTLNFAELYGAGIAVIMVWLECLEQEARGFKSQYAQALPGVRELKDSIDDMCHRGQPIITIGGREYHPETPKYINGRLRNFFYKMLNYLIQGSAADQSKQAMIDYYHHPKRRGRLMFPVHDELVISVLKSVSKQEAAVLAGCMRNSFRDRLDVPFLTDISMGVNYGTLN